MTESQRATERIDDLFDALNDGEVVRKALFGNPALYTVGKAFVWADNTDARVQLKLPAVTGEGLIVAGFSEVGWMGPRPVKGWYTLVEPVDAQQLLELAATARDHVRAEQARG
ncbi:hypothetical protein EG850_00515 [Gulosibacter macacae]|uniref:TfoX N-terminal domain-containing protein n=1 Tax=Gulosibacter macacae TaxID=2488791 RepID=A0A3P3W0V7_9MICO|nr:hypothetical protein [Gulosibacter macacae]RRJ88665.1 hypothetical protein EG850_00515 [Gulosibacter macacae]